MKTTATIISCILVLAATTAFANSMRCNKGIVSVGDSQAAVMGKCGSPAAVNQHANIERETRRTTAINNLETWTYNFGPNAFMYQLNMKNGIVESIQSLGTGY